MDTSVPILGQLEPYWRDLNFDRTSGRERRGSRKRMLGGCRHRVVCGAAHIIWGGFHRLRLPDSSHERPRIFGLVPTQIADDGQYPLRFLGRIVFIYIATGRQITCNG